MKYIYQDLVNLTGERLRVYRNRKKMSQADLGEKIKKSHVFLGRVERGEASIDLDSLFGVCKALDVPLSLLFENVDIGRAYGKEIPQKFYDLVVTLDEENQLALYELVKTIIEYGELQKK